MERRTLAFRALVVGLVLFGPLAVVRSAPQAPAPQPSTATLVPVNVHVVDRNGKPVTDLAQSDFTVSEDGASVPIRYFAPQDITAAAAGGDVQLAPRAGASALSPQNHRIFLIMLGRGRLEEPTKALSSVIAFVRKLLPQDRVAVFAHNRALPFTADHERVAQALERCRKVHLDVDLDVDNQLGPLGMVALYGRKAVPKKTQTRIDEMVHGAGAPAPQAPGSEAFAEKDFAALSLDDFMFSSAQTLQDRGNLQMIVEYLRHYDGEKHVLLVTEKGLDKASTLPSDEHDQLIAELAGDARTAIHTVQSGGMFAATQAGKELDTTQQQALAFAELRTIADRTGGLSSIVEQGGTALGRFDEMTRTGYLLGYQPVNSTWDGRYRTITVRVNRPDVTVLHRRGYYRVQDPGGFDRRSQIVVDRLMAAGNFRREVNDIKLKAKASQNQGKGGGDLTVEGKIDLTKVTLTPSADGKRSGLLDVAVFCVDSAEQPVGSHTTKLEFSLSDDEYARYKKDGMPYELHFQMHRGTERVRFVVYDYRADLIGRADTRIF